MINFWKIRGAMVVVCMLAITENFAQNFSQHNWYFGNSVRGIRFSRTDNSASLVTNKATPFGTGGSGVASDQTNANLLFYTDGARVFDVTHVQMPNGFGLNALTTANQPVAISPIPGVANQFYIFTNTASFTTGGTISVTTVDMNASGNDVFPEPRIGNVTTKNVAIGLAGRSEAMITIPRPNTNEFWLITHENGTDNYTVTLVGTGGTFTHNNLTDVTGGFAISAANFSYHEGSGRIAVSPQTADRNVAILDFDNATGTLTFNQFVLNSAATTVTSQSIYDTEWSNNGRFLYISRHGEAGIPAEVVQYDLNNPGISLAPVLSLNPDKSYGLQMAPDSAIYHLYQATAGGPFLLGTLTNTDSVASSVVHTPDAFGGGLDFMGRQFPAFAARATINLVVSFTTDGTCAISPVSFYPIVTPGADSLLWDFGDGQGSNQWSPIHAYQTGGTYSATVTAFLNGQVAVGNGIVNITPFDLQLTLAQDTTACECELPVNNGVPPCPNDVSDDFSITVQTQGGSGALTFIWSNGDTGPTLTPDSAGYYYVVVTDGSGCTAYAGVNIREYDATDQRANIWYFGQNAGINFNNPITPIVGPLNTPEGCSVISDRNGQVIFSTDGVRVYDRNDAEIIIPVPPGIGGEQGSTQSALIMPIPGDETLYYIFTTQEVHGLNTYELRYSLYDIKLNGGNGGLAESNHLLFSRSTERITGGNNWLIAHEYGNNSFRAYQISLAGIGNPVISSIGSDHLVTDASNGQGYMELGFQNQLAVAFSTSGVSNFIEVFNFDIITGEVTNFRSVDLNSSTEQVYGIEFFGNKLFATLRGNPSFLREVYFDFQGNPVLVPPLVPPAGAINEELGAIQTGPDGQVYVAVNNQPFLGTIQINPDTLQLSGLTLNGFPLAGGTQSRLGLPNFVQNLGNAPQPATMSVAGFCEGTPTNFVGTGTDPIDEFQWSFGDGFGSDSAVAQHTYPITGVPTNYLVTLRVTNRCGLDTVLTQTITIVPPPALPTFLPPGQQPVLCTGALTLEAEPTPSPGFTYLWSTGETTRTIVVNQQSLVGVTITNAQGCTSSGSLIVADNRPQVDLGPDQTICENSGVFPLDAQNPGTTYTWFINNVNTGNTNQTQSVSTITPGIFEYKVQVLDPVTSCFVRDSLVFTINPSPDFNAVPSNTTACGASNGQIALTIISPASTLFSFSVVGVGSGISLSDIDRPVGPVLPVFGGLPADTYVIQVSDQVSGCATIASFGISDNVISIVSATPQSPTCNPIPIAVQTAGIVSFVGATYTITNSGTGVQVIPPTSFSTANFTTLAVPVPGDYTIQINAQGCVATFNLSIVSDPQTAVTFVPDLCNAQVTAQAAGATFDWSSSPAGSISGATNGATVTINPGTWGLIVVANDGVNCPGTGNITVTVEPPIVASFTQSDACENQVTLSATPTGTYTYRWYDNGVPLLGGSSIIIGTSEHGDTYGVEVVSTLTGCVSPLFSQQVFVAGDLQLSMTTTVPCSGSTFTLTATSNIPGTNFQWGVDGSDIAGAILPTLDRTTAGLYRVTGTLPGCSEFIEQQIILFPNTPGSLPVRALICNDPANPNPDTREILLDAGPNFVSYQWFQNDVLSSNTTQTFLVTEPAIYRVELQNTFGCASTDQTEVIEECRARIVAPTAFRPGSTNNETNAFYVFAFFVADTDFQVFIYNRWGEMVHQSSEVGFRWNGGYNNSTSQLLPAGTYTYIVKYKSSYRPQDGIQEQRGGVVLLR